MDNRPYLGLNFINVLRTAFMFADPKCTKKEVKLAVLFGTFGTYERKSCGSKILTYVPFVIEV